MDVDFSSSNDHANEGVDFLVFSFIVLSLKNFEISSTSWILEERNISDSGLQIRITVVRIYYSRIRKF